MADAPSFAVPEGYDAVTAVARPDGVVLRQALARSTAPTGDARGTVVLIQGRTEFLEKYAEVVAELTAAGFDVLAHDHRGQGLSTRPLADPHKGHVDRFDAYVDDALACLASPLAADARGPRVALGHSLGGLVTLRTAALYPDLFQAVALSAPMLHIGAGPLTPFAPALARLYVRLGKGESYAPTTGPYGERARRFWGNVLTHDPDRFRRFHAQVDRDPRLALGGPTAQWLHLSFEAVAESRQPEFLTRVTAPVLMAAASRDLTVGHRRQREATAHLRGSTFLLLEGSKHEPLMEVDAIRDRLMAAILAHYDAALAE